MHERWREREKGGDEGDEKGIMYRRKRSVKVNILKQSKGLFMLWGTLYEGREEREDEGQKGERIMCRRERFARVNIPRRWPSG